MSDQESRRQLRLARQLSDIELWKGLGETELKALAHRLLAFSFPAEHTLFRKNDPSESLYIVLKGSVKLLDPERGAELDAIAGNGESVALIVSHWNTPPDDRRLLL